MRRLKMAFSTPRRFLLTALIAVLAVAWTGQTVASMLLREPYATNDFRRWLAVTLFAWCLWHVVRVAWKRPETAIEWSEEDEALIVGGPFAAHEQLLYRFAVILTATLPKAVLTMLVLWPDLSWSSPVGLVPALVGLELFRMMMDISSCCLSRTAWQAYRFGVVGALAAIAVASPIAFNASTEIRTTQQIVELARFQQVPQMIDALLSNNAVAVAATPFLWSADVIAARGSTGALCAKTAAMLFALATMAGLISVLYSVWTSTVIRRERQQWKATLSEQDDCALPRPVSTSVSAHRDSCVSQTAIPLPRTGERMSEGQVRSKDDTDERPSSDLRPPSPQLGRRERPVSWVDDCTSSGRMHSESIRLPSVPFCWPLVWRQCRRAYQYSGSLLISMVIPAILLCPPLISIQDPVVAFLLVVAGALFYTFVLLPEAIKFDFRLDTDHMCRLRMLPMTPVQVVLGQLATPVLLATLFQMAVFVAAGMYRSVEPELIVTAMALAVPLTVLFVALDNLTFLLYPQRPTQEGLEAFLRTILKFTGKTMLLALFAGAAVMWAPLAALIADGMHDSVSVRSVFAIGIIAGIIGAATLAVSCVASAFRRFDVSVHGLS